MELQTKNNYECIHKETIEYVDKKTGEIKNLYKIYMTNTTDGIQEQLLVNKDSYVKLNKGDKGLILFDKTQQGCYFKGIIASK